MKLRKEAWGFICLGVVAIFCAVALLNSFLSPFSSTNLPVAEILVWCLLLASILGMVLLGLHVLKAKDSSRDQMDFVYQMTHELQTPVASIRLAADMLVAPVVIETPEKLHKYVRIIKEESQRMQWHIENVLNIAQAESHSLRLNLETTPLNDLVYSVVERYDGTIKADCRAQQSLVKVDRLHLINVLHNLLENALKYSPEQPVIYVTTYDQDGSYVIAVRDNGVGIAPEEKNKIFQKFYRIPGTSGSVKGFGLGLSYVQQIVNAHHWQLELDSTPGKGSEFRVSIPRNLPAV
ncbi:HAMP domain-containing sensor histidine kinase [Telluribacter sp.]|jgi:two-component system phosphate regulon sensor histidine kinase PhoR|uniref:sensor histidine kinase n=1 Tax=Telluribacter sp. TaxID=1978767 RepID=UPI002E10B73E|nr:HAMP domain-containing sensor histidine kinase [Telluribacter sp.]